MNEAQLQQLVAALIDVVEAAEAAEKLAQAFPLKQYERDFAEVKLNNIKVEFRSLTKQVKVAGEKLIAETKRISPTA